MYDTCCLFNASKITGRTGWCAFIPKKRKKEEQVGVLAPMRQGYCGLHVHIRNEYNTCVLAWRFVAQNLSEPIRTHTSGGGREYATTRAGPAGMAAHGLVRVVVSGGLACG